MPRRVALAVFLLLGCGESPDVTPDSVVAEADIGTSSPLATGVPSRLRIMARQKVTVATCGDDSQWGCNDHCNKPGTTQIERFGDVRIGSVACEGPCAASRDEDEDQPYVTVTGTGAGEGTLVVDIESDGVAATLRRPLRFDTPKALALTQSFPTAPSSAVRLPGESFGWCATVSGLTRGEVDARSMHVVASGAVALDPKSPPSAIGDTMCASLRAVEKGRGSVSFSIGDVEAHRDVDVVAPEDVRSLEVVLFPDMIVLEKIGVDEDPLRGRAPTTELLFSTEIFKGACNQPAFAVRFRTADGRMGFAPATSISFDPPSIFRPTLHPDETFQFFYPPMGPPGTNGTLTARVGSAITTAAVRFVECAPTPPTP